MRSNLKFVFTTMFVLTLILGGFFIFKTVSVSAEEGLVPLSTAVPTILISSHDALTKTITYTFSEPVHLVKQDTHAPTPLTANLLGIYAIDSSGNYDLSTKSNVTIESANLDSNNVILTVVYSGSLEKMVDTNYLIDAWGYSITNETGDVIGKDAKAVFTIAGDKIAPTAKITHDEIAKTITYAFSEPVQLLDADNKTVLTNYASNLAIYDAASYEAFVKFGTEPTKITSAAITGATLTDNTLTINYSGSLVNKTDSSYVIDAWGKNITDIAGNKMIGDKNIVFTITGDTTAPTVTSIVSNNPGTIVYNFDEAVKLMNSDYSAEITPAAETGYSANLGIYKLSEYATHVDGTPAPVKYGTITNATLTNGNKTLTITYTGSLVNKLATDYIVDAWGSNITDTLNNKMLPSPSTQVFTITATEIVSQTSGGGSSYVPIVNIVDTTKGCLNSNKFNTLTGLACTTVAVNGKVLGAEKYNFVKLMKKGLDGDEVTELQKLLTTLGYDLGTTDGKFGTKTKNAVIKFQIANNLKGDGIVGAMTRIILNK